jgi:hypothetical protein
LSQGRLIFQPVRRPAKSRRYVPGADYQDTLDTVMSGSNRSAGGKG